MSSVEGTPAPRIRTGIVGLGKMGLSHMALVNVHPAAELSAVCDSSGYVLGVLSKYTGTRTFTSYERMLDEADLDAVFIATPSSAHAAMVETALGRGLHVFCEKPFTLDPGDSQRLAELAGEQRVVTQVGYHYRHTAPFQEAKRVIDSGALGRVAQAVAEAYGPVVLKEKGTTWRSSRKQGGGCLYDYAAHAVDLLQWYLGDAREVRGATLEQVFSSAIDDAVTGTITFDGGVVAQLIANWSDASRRRMKTAVRLWGEKGWIYVDRQECQVFLRETPDGLDGYAEGWNVRYTTDLTAPVWFYLRGEEYSAQVDEFFQRIGAARLEGNGTFSDAASTDRILGMIAADAAGDGNGTHAAARRTERRRWRRGRAA